VPPSGTASFFLPPVYCGVPELPEVEAARHVVAAALVGREIVGVDAVADPIVFVRIGPPALRKALVGRTVTGVGRKGKHLWIEMDRRPWLALHFGMTGALHVLPPGRERPRSWKLEITADDGGRIVYTDPRRFGRVRLHQDPPHEPPISELGHDPLEGLPPVAALHALLQRRARAVKPLLLDQAIFAGVGNWIADEVLFQAGISPHRPASSLSLAEVRKLRSSILSVIRTAVKVGADSDRFPKGWLFHHRWGGQRSYIGASGPVRGKGPGDMVRETIGGRTAAWVPARQK
jgi:formamidopyrimidine-DNA glycosylase